MRTTLHLMAGSWVVLLVSLCFLIGCPSKQPTDTRPVVAGMNASLKYTLEESILKPYWERGRLEAGARAPGRWAVAGANLS